MRADRSEPARGLATLQEIAALLSGAEDQEGFAGRLCSTVAQMVGAEKVLLFQLQPDGTASALRGAFGVTGELMQRLSGIPCRPEGVGVADRVVFRDLVFRADLKQAADEVAEYRPWLELLGARNALAVAWRAGEYRLGALVAYDAKDPAGFTDEDVWVAQVSAVTAGLVWQQRGLASQLLAAQAEETEMARAVAERMTALERTKSDLLNLAAHELRGPLTVIRGYLSMLQDGSLSTANLARVLPTLNDKAQQMDFLVTQMLETARLEEGLLKLDRKRFDIRPVVRQAVETAGLLTAPGHWVTFDQPAAPVMIDGDDTRINTVVANLVDNAVKYSPAGGPVICSVRVEDGRALVRVRDSGLGIAAEDIPRLFSRFGRILTPENSHIPGTGLGLHICLVLARMHGGDITVDSAPGKGSTFTLALPVAEFGALSPVP